MHSICKLLNICFELKVYRELFYNMLCQQLEYSTHALIRLMFTDQFPEQISFDETLIEALSGKDLAENVLTVREHVEMDNKMLLLIGYLLYEDYINRYDLLVCPMLGASQIPTFFNEISLFLSENGFKTYQLPYDFIKYSTYDITQFLPLNEQMAYLTAAHPDKSKILILDESLGTGITVLKVRDTLKTYFSTVDTGAIEYKWDKKIIWSTDREWFDIDAVDYVTPVSYRHYLLLDNQIRGFKMNVANIIPYTPFMIYDDYNFNSYITAQNISYGRKKRMNDIFGRARAIQNKFYG